MTTPDYTRLYFPPCTGGYDMLWHSNREIPTKQEWNDRGILNTAQLCIKMVTSEDSVQILYAYV
jgi:hypothetical protein